LRFGAAFLRFVVAFFRVVFLRVGAALRFVVVLRLVVVFLRFGAAFLVTARFFAVVFLLAVFFVAIPNLHCSRIAHGEYKQRFTNYQ
jgi:hypothetical protein